jgi:AIPR protein
MARKKSVLDDAESTWSTALKERSDLTKFSNNAIGLFALGLRFDIDDLDSTGTASVVDGSSDKKIDILFIDEEISTAVIIQAYVSKIPKPIAPSNKASDLNTAVTWLIGMKEKDLPEQIRTQTIRLRQGIDNGEITKLYFWYVHNCTESKNVEDELAAVTQTLQAALHKHHKTKKISTFVNEVGNSTLTSWYSESQSPIVVNQDFKFPCSSGFKTSGKLWESFVTVLPAIELHNAYKTHGVSLFSANIRDYLGARSSQSNINNGIKQTLNACPENFWVFNNGLTVLTHKFNYNGKDLKVKGLAIVNGAQTTGAIGSLDTPPAASAQVLIRFVTVSTGNTDLIHDIVRYNNSQNQVTAADFRSNDSIQKRLRTEVSKIKDAEYEGGRRGGFGSAIKRRPNLLPSFTVGQALASFHGSPIIAYNQKSEIWIHDPLYTEFFNEKTTGNHLIFCFSLLKAIENEKNYLYSKSKNNDKLTKIEQQKIEFFRLPAATFVYCNAISASLETILDTAIHDLFILSFGNSTPSRAIANWAPIIKATAPFARILSKTISTGLSKSAIDEDIQNFIGQVSVAASNSTTPFERFAKLIKNT